MGVAHTLEIVLKVGDRHLLLAVLQGRRERSSRRRYEAAQVIDRPLIEIFGKPATHTESRVSAGTDGHMARVGAVRTQSTRAIQIVGCC